MYRVRLPKKVLLTLHFSESVFVKPSCFIQTLLFIKYFFFIAYIIYEAFFILLYKVVFPI